KSASLEVAFSLPPTWYQKALVYGLNTSGMFLSGLIMVTRNRHLTCIPRLLAWPAVLFSLNQLINQHPLRSKDGAGGWSNMMCVRLSLCVLYSNLLTPLGSVYLRWLLLPPCICYYQPTTHLLNLFFLIPTQCLHAFSKM
ncbi:hypothetical protein BDQ17DRAFT_1265844, partial [Cyathus striatus]